MGCDDAYTFIYNLNDKPLSKKHYWTLFFRIMNGSKIQTSTVDHPFHPSGAVIFGKCFDFHCRKFSGMSQIILDPLT